MARKHHLPEEISPPDDPWQPQIAAVAARFNREYRGEKIDLPAEVTDMPIHGEYRSGALQSRLVSPFWELAQPQKNQHCLDIGCGVGFLVYPWREWGAYFHGQEVSSVAQECLQARGPQLNSKLFKGVVLGPAHQLSQAPASFDLVIATGLSCYYRCEYWQLVLGQVQRVLKPGGSFVFDILDPTQPLAENWAILETYLGAEVFLEPLATWEQVIQASGGKTAATKPAELFRLYKVHFS